MIRSKVFFAASMSCRGVRQASLLAALLIAACGASAQISSEDLRLPISMDAESSIYDGKSSMLVFTGLRLSQGSISIKADDGRASSLDFADSLWQFSGNVVIDTGSGHIECDAADLSFVEHQLISATISGEPATFRILRPEDQKTTYAEAGKLDYNFKLGVVEFSENAVITEGGNQISSHFLVYDIAEQRINAQSAGTDGDRVKIIYTPKSAEESATPDSPSTEGAEQSDIDPAHDNSGAQADGAKITEELDR